MQEIHDPEGYTGEYVPHVLPLLQKHGAQVLLAGSDQRAAEGGAAEQHGRDPLR